MDYNYNMKHQLFSLVGLKDLYLRDVATFISYQTTACRVFTSVKITGQIAASRFIINVSRKGVN
jgi:hypothetical protein